MRAVKKFFQEFPNWILNPVVILGTLLVWIILFLCYTVQEQNNQTIHRRIQTCEKHDMFYMNGNCYPKENR